MEAIANQIDVKYLGIGAIIFVALILFEIVWSVVKKKEYYSLKDSLTNLGFLVGSRVIKLISGGFQLGVFFAVSKLAMFQINKSVVTFIITFILVDFFYYWYHRLSHTNPFFWAFHLTHHSSNHFNFTTSYRLHWLGGIVSSVFYFPMLILGFPVEFVIGSIGLNLGYQFLLHTQLVNKVGVLEGVIDTPSAHRVHHAVNPKYIDKNFGGVFMIWDVLFGTYQAEDEKPIYGITTGFISYNPIKIMVYGFKRFFIKKTKRITETVKPQ